MSCPLAHHTVHLIVRYREAHEFTAQPAKRKRRRFAPAVASTRTVVYWLLGGLGNILFDFPSGAYATFDGFIFSSIPEILLFADIRPAAHQNRACSIFNQRVIAAPSQQHSIPVLHRRDWPVCRAPGCEWRDHRSCPPATTIHYHHGFLLYSILLYHVILPFSLWSLFHCFLLHYFIVIYFPLWSVFVSFLRYLSATLCLFTVEFLFVFYSYHFITLLMATNNFITEGHLLFTSFQLLSFLLITYQFRD
jgi:hypothetical protein